MSSLESAIREGVVRYLAGEITLDQLQEQVIVSAFDADDQTDPAGSMYAYGVELALSEYEAGHLGQSGLGSELRRLAGSGTLGTPQRWATFTAATSQTAVVPLRIAAVGKPRAAALA